jgi:hypothetical protein
MLYVGLATEDELSEAVGKRLLAEIEQPIEANLLFRKNGDGYLRSNIKKWCALALQQPVILITDLDKNPCPARLMDDWFVGDVRPTNLVFRVAVKEVEAWLLADHDAMRELIGEKGKLPIQPDMLPDPKQHLLELARKANREVRQDLIKASGAVASQGIGYNARLADFVAKSWNPMRAANRSPSLQKAIVRLQELGQRFA